MWPGSISRHDITSQEGNNNRQNVISVVRIYLQSLYTPITLTNLSVLRTTQPLPETLRALLSVRAIFPTRLSSQDRSAVCLTISVKRAISLWKGSTNMPFEHGCFVQRTHE
jgi:hypothetical protein